MCRIPSKRFRYTVPWCMKPRALLMLLLRPEILNPMLYFQTRDTAWPDFSVSEYVCVENDQIFPKTLPSHKKNTSNHSKKVVAYEVLLLIRTITFCLYFCRGTAELTDRRAVRTLKEQKRCWKNELNKWKYFNEWVKRSQKPDSFLIRQIRQLTEFALFKRCCCTKLYILKHAKSVRSKSGASFLDEKPPFNDVADIFLHWDFICVASPSWV